MVPINTKEKPKIAKAGIPVYLLPNLSIISPTGIPAFEGKVTFTGVER